MEKLSGPVYGTWDEAMTDPNLDLSKPWFFAPDAELPQGVYRAPADAKSDFDWPDGWTSHGLTDDR